ncbi:SDR family NAD(P)-dependent oxidoreductase [Actinoplanes sp. NPDC051851]|uniref:SDR family NAD(P)-dependent oxidoreductase n=1 Tax=Actinoplanes sp. NPDC051851 TaxID=3154753 RepID=UPI003433788E
MSTTPPNCLPVLVVTGGTGIEPSPFAAAAATAAGATAIVDLGAGTAWALRSLRQAAARAGIIGVRVPAGCTATVEQVIAATGGAPAVVVLTGDSPWAVRDVPAGTTVLVEVTSVAEARATTTAGAHGLIARGMESGGRVSDLSTFVLLQKLVGTPITKGRKKNSALPIWAAGGIGPRTAAAAVAGGAAGVLLDSQLLLMPEAELADGARALIGRMDGTEVVTGENGHRVLRTPAGPLGVGEDGALAGAYGKKWTDTAGAVRAVRTAIREAVSDETASGLLVPGGPLAQALGIELPVAQGPMTRVSDEPGFAAAVAEAGGLPFLALALADGVRTERMMNGAVTALGDRKWGVGILGFAPEQVKAAQIEVIRRIKPAFAIIAGGRPAQAKSLEDEGIRTFLHVPSPGLLRQFLQAGARRFIFEGAECGGHVGPKASFPLWEAQLGVLDEFLTEKPGEEIQVFFAGGIHDARSAAMVAAMAAPFTTRGLKIGVLMGTAYLFTEEAVRHGAILPHFQREAVKAESTALLETAPGHATRCLSTKFVDDFHELREGLTAAGVDHRQVWEQLETLNVGRLRVASKGLKRQGDELITVNEAGQADEGLFMAGQVSVLRDRVTTIAELHAAVTSGMTTSAPAETAPAKEPEPLDIAIIGMACVFPGSGDLSGYWRTILDGSDAVTEIPADRWDVGTYYAPEVGPGQAGRITVSKWGGFIDPVPFDAIGYGIPPSALASIDPTQLLALEVSARSLADAGYPYQSNDHGKTGVVFGAEAGGDLAGAKTVRALLPAFFGDVPEGLDEQLPAITEDSFPGVLANVIAGRVANRLDLGGPNFTVDAACASSLAALDAACKELATGGSDLMICGGADLHNGINDYLMFTSAHALSPTGRCRTFDSTGDGIALGEGVATVVLKRLADAERDGDRVYAVLKGLGGASDGRALGLTAPRMEGQRRALDRAYAQAGVSPREVGLVEAHGTGTVVGDRTELETLTRVYQEAGAEPGGCTLGSVKSQIGHTKCAAGLAGVIKAALALHHGVRPPTINLSRPNPAWSAEHSPFAFTTAAQPWTTPVNERIAAVSAFGFGGTNYHAVLAAHPAAAEPRHARTEWPAELFCFRSLDQVRRLLDRVGEGATLFDLARANVGAGPVRIAVVAHDLDELRTLLHRALNGEHDPRNGLVQPAAKLDGRLAFLFPGQGSQRPGALADLFVAFPELHHYLDLGRDWADLLFPPTAFDAETEKAQKDRLRDTRNAQPALGIGGLAVDHLLRRLGVRPDLTAGHSYGELVALCVSGAFDPATLLELSRDRAAAILAAAGDDPGTMAAVSATPARITEVLDAAGLAGTVVLANHNAPSQVVVSGTTEAVRTASAALGAAGLTARSIPVACAFHSPVVAAASETFAEVLARGAITAPAGEVWANRTAAAYGSDASSVRTELSLQVASPVRFVDQIEAMYASGARVFVEAGPGQVLTGLVGAVLGDRPHLAVSVDGRADGITSLLLAVAQLACAGVPVNTGWLFQGRSAPAGAAASDRPLWTVDGQLVRAPNGDLLPGGLQPARPIPQELIMTTTHHHQQQQAPDGQGALLAEYLRTTREMISSQRDVMLAFLGQAPVPTYDAPAYQEADLVPAMQMQALSAAPISPAPAPAPMPAPMAAPMPAPMPVAAPSLDVQGAVLAVISDRTGYPVELIELDLDLEADLSVDSIKRAEVAGEVATRLGLAVDGAEGDLEDLVRARTVRAMVEWLGSRIGGAPAAPAVNGAVNGFAPAAVAVAVDVQGAVLAVISDRTGYPVELIELDLDLEADLSVDSIKRAEVAGEVATRLGLAIDGAEGDLEDLVRARTVRAMTEWLDGRINGVAVAAAPDFPEPAPAASQGAVAGNVPALTEPEPEKEKAPSLGIAPQRLVPVWRAAEAHGDPGAVSGAHFLITGASPVGGRLTELLAEAGASSAVATFGDDPAHADGVILLDGLLPDGAPILPDAFGFLRTALTGGARWVVAAGRPGDPTDGLRGLFRTVAREYPAITARYVEIDPDVPADDIAAIVLRELGEPATAPVILHSPAGRFRDDLEPRGLGVLADGGAGPAGDGVAEARAMELDADAVIVMVGGARGITPWFARVLASASRCRIELVGRTPLPEGRTEPDLPAGMDKAALRAALARRGMRSPAEIDRTARAILASREVEATMAELTDLGASVRYHSVDVRDADATKQLITKIHDEYGRIDGVVYAAGIIEDKLIAEKDPESFARVYRTKVDGAATVLDAMDVLDGPARFVVLFGSIAAAYGNRGQSDYAAANDALDSYGSRWSERIGQRLLTVHWGPWAPGTGHGGMVSPELVQEYARRGIALIDPEEGALSLLRELAWGDSRSVVYTASGW